MMPVVESEKDRPSRGHRAASGAVGWAPYVLRARAEFAAGDLAAARADAGRAIEREPTDPRHLVLLAAVEAADGRVEAARDARGAALRLAAPEAGSGT